MYDKSEFLATVARKRQETGAGMVPAARVVQAAATYMSQLTTDLEHWNRFLTYLQGQVEKTRAAREDAQRKMADPAVWDPQALAKLKSDILTADAMIAAWQFAMELPKGIIAGGGAADEIITKFERRNEAAGQVNP